MEPGASLERWPGADRRRPPAGLPSWSIRAPLAVWLEEEARTLGARGRYRVLDVGCGVKPYYPFFAPWAAEYVGVDVVDNPAADLRGGVEQLPVEDGSFDVVLCTQVLEHVDDPARAVRELRRVLAPGGSALVSTHGVMVYHPNPVDLWRWTHTGLERLFTSNGDWDRVRVVPGAGTAACLGMLLATYLHLLAKQARVSAAARPPIALVNRVAGALDRRVARLRQPVPGAIFANYHVVAEAPR